MARIPDQQRVDQRLRELLENPPFSFDLNQNMDDYLWSDLCYVIASLRLKYPNLKPENQLQQMQQEEERVELQKAAYTAFSEKDWAPLCNHPLLFQVAPTTRLSSSIEGQKIATIRSWDIPYIGDAKASFLAYVDKWFHKNGHPNKKRSKRTVYGNFLTIVQSSGMGKSRLMDELSKSHFLIPMNLREFGSQGYPPPDSDLRDFLCNSKSHQASVIWCYFLAALFRHTLKFIANLRSKQDSVTYHDAAIAFRAHMRGEDFDETSYFRQAFYKTIIEDVRNSIAVYSTSTAVQDPNDTAFSELQALTDMLTGIQGTTTVNMPLVYLSFDECHTLTWYTELQHVLETLKPQPLFTCFLSTTGKISQYSPAAKNHPSIVTRIPPFTCLGFDQLVKNSRFNQSSSLESISDISSMVRYGRPLFGARYEQISEIPAIMLFAAQKLLGVGVGGRFEGVQQLACISRRLPIDFYTTTSAYQEQEEQVEGHLRVCLHIDSELQVMTTVSPSEPLLSEVAARLTYDKSSPVLLENILHGFSIDQGDRGEFIGMQFCLDARDAAVYSGVLANNSAENTPIEKLDDDLQDDEPQNKRHNKKLNTRINWALLDLRPQNLTFSVCDFLRGLFNMDLSNVLPSRTHPKHKGQTLDTLFKHAKMNFSHFIKVHQFSAVENPYLPAVMARASALLCPTNEEGIDAVCPFTFGLEDVLDPQNIGAILLRFQNSSTYTSSEVKHLVFNNMDPLKLGILAPGNPPIPIIRIMFSLATKCKNSLTRNQDDGAHSEFTSFDFWCSGINSKVLKQVKSNEEPVWQSILAASRPWQQIYAQEEPEDTITQRTLRSQNPLAATHEDFYSSFFDFTEVDFEPEGVVHGLVNTRSKGKQEEEVEDGQGALRPLESQPEPSQVCHECTGSKRKRQESEDGLT